MWPIFPVNVEPRTKRFEPDRIALFAIYKFPLLYKAHWLLLFKIVRFVQVVDNSNGVGL